MKFPKLVIFDMDGLIFDSERLYRYFLRLVMNDFGYDLTDAVYADTLGLTDEATKEKMFHIFGSNFEYQKIYSLAREKMMVSIDEKGLPIKKGIENLLNYLQENKISCCVASSTKRSDVLYFLIKCNLINYFDFFVCGDEVKNSKPKPDIFLKACTISDVAPEEALVLEDSENGLLAAISGNIPVICIPDLVVPRREILNRVVVTLSDADEVIIILEKTKVSL
ncbi:MAG: HAD family phosphatase [Bacilli bacterium]|nr:HAD family phosphatase [Bacilli bacterium]